MISKYIYTMRWEYNDVNDVKLQILEIQVEFWLMYYDIVMIHHKLAAQNRGLTNPAPQLSQGVLGYRKRPHILVPQINFFT